MHMHEIGYQKSYILLKILNSSHFIQTYQMFTSHSHVPKTIFTIKIEIIFHLFFKKKKKRSVTDISNNYTLDGATSFFHGECYSN